MPILMILSMPKELLQILELNVYQRPAAKTICIQFYHPSASKVGSKVERDEKKQQTRQVIKKINL